MKTLRFKATIMIFVYLLCNYFIWFGINNCIGVNKLYESAYFPVKPEDSLFFPLSVLLPISLFQPHIVILYKVKPLQEYKHKRIFWWLSSCIIAATIIIWAFVLYKIVNR